MAASPNSQDILSLPPNLPPTGLAYLAGIIHIFLNFRPPGGNFQQMPPPHPAMMSIPPTQQQPGVTRQSRDVSVTLTINYA